MRGPRWRRRARDGVGWGVLGVGGGREGEGGFCKGGLSGLSVDLDLISSRVMMNGHVGCILIK